MTLFIDGGRLYSGASPISYRAARHIGPAITPRMVVVHDTAGALRPFSSVEWLEAPTSTVSAHFVVERDGTITQMVPTDRMAYHCGVSEWPEGSGKSCNGRAIGIEVVSPGPLLPRGDKAVASFGHLFGPEGLLDLPETAHHQAALWLDYTDQQIAAVEAIVAAIGKAYPTVTEVVGHYQISPRRKVDPGPHFPLAQMAAVLPERRPAAPADAVAEIQSRLGELGYAPGAADGEIGPRTIGAVASFQAQNGIAVTGRLDQATVATVTSAQAAPMPTGARAEVTAEDLRAQGSRTIKLWDRVRSLARWLLGLGTGDVAAQQLTGASIVEASSDVLTKLKPMLGGTFAPLASPRVMIITAMIGIGLVLLRIQGVGTAVRVDDARTGAATGVGGKSAPSGAVRAPGAATV